MSVLLNPTPIRHSSQHHQHIQQQQHHQQQQQQQREAMTIPFPDHASLSYGLITPPSELRTTRDPYSDSPSSTIFNNSALMDPNNIPPHPANTRYYLRKQPLTQTALHPGVVNNSYTNNHYNSYLQFRRRSGSTSASSTSTTLIRPTSPSLDFESREFNVGEFAATMVCFLWFEPLSIVEYAGTYNDPSQIHALVDDSIPPPDFIEFCTRVIRTTAVSKEVALLGLLFIHRLRMKNIEVQGKSGSQWRIFTIALMLGNKILDDNTYTNKTWSDVTKILNVEDIKVMEVEFLSQMRYNLFVTPQQWEDWKVRVSRMYTYHRDSLRQRNMQRKVLHSTIPPSPPVSSTATSPSFSDQVPYLPAMAGSPFRMQFNQQHIPERISSPHRTLPPMDDSPSSASAAIHARVSRKRSREENVIPPSLQPPTKRYQQQFPAPLGIQIPVQPQRLNYSLEGQHSQQYAQSISSRNSISLETNQNSSPSYSIQQSFPLQPVSPSFPTSPYASVSPLSPYSTTSNYTSLSPYANLPHRQMQPSNPNTTTTATTTITTPTTTTPQPQILDHPQSSTGYTSGFSSPYKYLQNRFSPYAPVRPVRTLPSQFNPPRMQWGAIPPMPSEDLWYQPLGLHGHSGLRRGIPEYNPGYPYSQ